MRLLLNIIWLVVSGVCLFCGSVLAGIIAGIFNVTIPFGVASFRVAGYVLWPFGREVVAAPGAGVGSGIGNVIWFLVAGLGLALGHIATAFLLAITVIGLPLAWANLKLIPVTCFPFGKRVVRSRDLAKAPLHNPGYAQ